MTTRGINKWISSLRTGANEVNHMTLTIWNGGTLYENGLPNDKEQNAPFYIRVHGEKKIFHVVSFQQTEAALPLSEKQAAARAAAKSVTEAKNTWVLDLNADPIMWRKQQR